MVGTVQIRMRPAGRRTYDFYEFPLDSLNTREGGQFAGQIRESFSDLVLA